MPTFTFYALKGMTMNDTGFQYDPSKLFTKYSLFHHRFGYHHPAKPSLLALGYADVFMGWTRKEAITACKEANAALL